MNIKIFDCTFRDGGHLNKWNFDTLCVKASYYAALKSGVDYFETGYRFPEEKVGLGPFGYCRDKLLREIFDPSEHCKLAVMIDAGKCESSQFTECIPRNTPIQVVRVAAYPYELEKAIRLVGQLYDKGYEVFLNLMAASELRANEYKLLRNWKNKNVVSAVYFADSFGSFIPSDIDRFVDGLKSIGFERIGFHPHNNLQLAFANTLRAVEMGVACVDASIYGMGRCSGNLPIEILIGYLEKLGNSEYNTVPYLDIIDRYFLDLFQEIGWGYSLESLLTGLGNIHPYYVKSLSKNGLYTIDEIWNALHIIKEHCPISFSEDKLDQTLDGRFYNPLSQEKAEIVCREIAHEMHTVPAPDAFVVEDFGLKDKYKGYSFLVIATGPSILKYQENIKAFKERHNCIAIGVNNLQNLFEPEFHMFVNRKRFQQYAPNICEKSALLVPSFFGLALVEENFGGKRYFFNLVAPCDPTTPPVIGSTQYCMNINVAVSAIIAAFQMGAREIYTVGMDGYVDEFNKKMVYFYNEDNKIDDKDVASLRYEMLVRELERVNAFLQKQSVKFSILTPTSHKKYYRSLKKV